MATTNQHGYILSATEASAGWKPLVMPRRAITLLRPSPSMPSLEERDPCGKSAGRLGYQGIS